VTSSLAARLGIKALKEALTPVLALADIRRAMYDHHDGKPRAKLKLLRLMIISSGGISFLVLYRSARRPAQGDRNTAGTSMQRNSRETPGAPAAFLSLSTTAKVVIALPRNEIPEAADSTCNLNHCVCTIGLPPYL
jgi:hypothetical protein